MRLSRSTINPHEGVVYTLGQDRDDCLTRYRDESFSEREYIDRRCRGLAVSVEAKYAREGCGRLGLWPGYRCVFRRERGESSRGMNEQEQKVKENGVRKRERGERRDGKREQSWNARAASSLLSSSSSCRRGAARRGAEMQAGEAGSCTGRKKRPRTVGWLGLYVSRSGWV
ncbi:hypothetical protein ALC62_08757 [Cyphomyrmex costatus]|uniref:Uncharacterized protein n=1 Tax=Cyphomyrmex costatus TaxID=456900 RepID=A0A195CIA9_9HYME|nr:hypothetical protein ALC62_08757 [Cyphomyrmex costatus]